MRDARRLAKPVPYAHPNGAVIWVKLKPAELKAIDKAGRRETFRWKRFAARADRRL